MDVLHAEADLHEPVQDLALWQGPAAPGVHDGSQVACAPAVSAARRAAAAPRRHGPRSAYSITMLSVPAESILLSRKRTMFGWLSDASSRASRRASSRSLSPSEETLTSFMMNNSCTVRGVGPREVPLGRQAPYQRHRTAAAAAPTHPAVHFTGEHRPAKTPLPHRPHVLIPVHPGEKLWTLLTQIRRHGRLDATSRRQSQWCTAAEVRGSESLPVPLREGGAGAPAETPPATQTAPQMAPSSPWSPRLWTP